MADNTKMVQAYIEKMMQIQDNQSNQPLSEQELKEIALDLGMTENDWLASQQMFEGYLANGKGHLLHQNWQDALEELSQAHKINPYHFEVAYGLARAYQGKYAQTKKDDDKQKAEEFAEQSLRIKAGFQPAIKVLNALRQTEKKTISGKKQKLYLLVGTVVIFTAIIFLVLFMRKSGEKAQNTAQHNEVIEKKEMVKQKWAQVENVYQRRADLIPQVVKVVKKAEEADQTMVDKLLKAHKAAEEMTVNDIENADFQNFSAKQNELTEVLKQLLEKMDESGNELYSGLMAQIEGANNRISVERKRYNEAVGKYNTLIQKSPYNEMDFKPIPYFKMNKGADKNPEIDL